MTVKLNGKTSTTRACANICPASSAIIQVEVCCQTDLCTQATQPSTASTSTSTTTAATSESTSASTSPASESVRSESPTSTTTTTTTSTTTSTATTTTTCCRNDSNRRLVPFYAYFSFLLFLLS